MVKNLLTRLTRYLSGKNFVHATERLPKDGVVLCIIENHSGTFLFGLHANF